MRRINLDRLCKNIDLIAKSDLDENKVFGSSYAVHQEGVPLLRRHYGVGNPELGIDTDDGTIYRLASMTKQVT